MTVPTVLGLSVGVVLVWFLAADLWDEVQKWRAVKRAKFTPEEVAWLREMQKPRYEQKYIGGSDLW